jgi:hypothetical protein
MGCGSSRQGAELAAQAAAAEQQAASELAAVRAELAAAQAAKEVQGQHIEAEDEYSTLLAAHLCRVIQLKPTSAVIQGYVSVLRSEGYDTPNDLNDLSAAMLQAEPFNFKRGHLNKVCVRVRARARVSMGGGGERERDGKNEGSYATGYGDGFLASNNSL